MQQETRPYTEQEIEALRKLKYSAWQHFENFGLKWAGISIVLLVPFLLFEKFVAEVPPSRELLIVIIIQGTAISLVLYWMKRYGELDWNKEIENEIKNGEAFVIRVKTDKVVKRKEQQDFGSGFYCKIDETRVLYLEGQYFGELQYSRKFPNTDFEIVRRNSDKELISYFSYGKYLKPERKLKPFTNEQYKKGEVHVDGDVLNILIDEIR